jgi:C4-dicarboxylate-specific signal transduction histidine kinase
MATWLYRKSQLARRLVVATVLFSSALTLVITSFQLYWQYRQDIADLHQSAAIIRDSWLESLTESIWDYDNAQIQLQLNGMVNLPLVEGVVLNLVDGQHLQAGELRSSNSRKYEHPLHYVSGGKDRDLGQLTIIADMGRVYSNLLHFALTVLLSNALKAALVVVFMLMVIQYLIGQHLAHIVRYLNRRDPPAQRQPLALERPDNRPYDELDALVNAYNNLQRQVEQEHQQLMDEGEKRAKLQQQLAQLDRQVTMGEMATSLAHELNQPLASITGYADICKHFISPPNPDMLEKTLEKVSAEALRASEIIRRTREFVRSRSMTREVLSLTQLVMDTTEIVAHMAQQYGVALKVAEPPDMDLMVEGDRIQLQQVLINLLRNAIDELGQLDSTDKWIQVCICLSEGDRLVVEVEDNGPGIHPSVLDTLFQPFVTTKSDGMGVGLAISHNIVEAHGGELRARNLVQGGAHFELVLPLVIERI